MTNEIDILLVEDNEGDVELTQSAFADSVPKCNLSVANDGMEAMDFLLKQGKFSAAPTPKLILLDLNMPRMDGRKFLEVVKNNDNLKAIPVVMFTSSSNQDDIRACYERQASCYVVKPFAGQEFDEAVREVVHFWGSLGRLPS